MLKATLPEVPLQPHSLREQLDVIVESLPPDEVTLGEIRGLVGPDGLLLLVAFLTLIFLVPVSIPGVSTVFGAAILLIGVSRLFRRTLWLPKRFQKRSLSTARLRGALHKGRIWVSRLERISRPHRLTWLLRGRLMEVLNNAALVLAAVLLMAPFGLIPFSNTLPGLALLCLAVGLMQRDGVAVLLGHLLNVATLLYFGALAIGGSVAIQEIFRQIQGSF
ncbi:MAG TPA: exopolysaccharide biosynthesis protein [Cyanobacteria bacterium UBA8156]|jgi:hypothetical protein|nr:exopolysaccharide biosynthesis protein [Cyanobacteria bacterium UBA8156]